MTTEEIEPIDERELARNIESIERAFTKLATGGLNRRAIEVLLHDSATVKGGPGQASYKVKMRDIKAVLDALPLLKSRYCTKPKKRRSR